MDSLSVSGALLRWSSVSWPLDLIVNKFRLPLLLRAEPGPGSSSECVGELVLVHSCRQWTAVTAHSLEEGHYVVGPRIEVPIHYTGWFKVLEQERDVGDPAQFFSSVEELAKAFPDRVFVIEDISFSVKVASGEFNEESELYHFALNAGDELTLMGQAEILCGRPSKDRSRLTTLLRKIGWLPGAAVNPRVARGKMPCLICMNHRTNESVSLPFECHGRFGTRSPLESQLHDGEHSLRSIVEHARLPVTVMVLSRPPPPRNPYDQHMVREGHRYKLVGLRARTVVVAVALHGRDSGQPGHYTLGASTPAPRFTLPEGLIKGERAYEDLVLDQVSWLNRWFDIEAYSCAVREARSDGADDAPSSPLKQGMANRPCAGGCGTLSIPSSLAYAREDLTQSFHRLSVCVYGNSLLENGDANLLLSSAEGGSDKSVAQMPSLCTFSDLTSSIDSNYVQPEESSEHAQASDRSELQYEELWTEQTALAASRYCCVSSLGLDSCSKAPRGGLVLRRGLSQELQGPPPVPPKSDAVRVECRMLNAPPVPPRSGRPSSSPPLPPRSVPPSPNLSFYSSGLLHLVDDAFDKIGGSSEWTKPPHNRSCKRIRPSSVGHPSPRHNADGVSNGTRRGSGPDTNSMSFYEQQPIFPGFAQTSLATVDFHSQSHVLAFAPPVTKVETLKNMSDKTPVSNGHTDVPNMSPVCKSSSPHDEFHLSKACACDHSRSPKHILAAEGSKPHSGCNCDCCIISTPNSPCTLPGDIDWPTETTECVPPSLPFCGTPGDRSSGDGMAWQPPDELSGLSVEGVCQCLRFIGLSEEALGRFSHECVDGALFTQLTEEMLLLDFQLSKLQARKVLQFAGGWRPKL